MRDNDAGTASTLVEDDPINIYDQIPAASHAPLRVIVIARDQLARAGLAMLLGDFEEITVIARLGSITDLAEAERSRAPDVAIWDLGWDAPGEQRSQTLDGETGAVPIAMLVANEMQAADALQAGARGVIRRDADGATLAAAIGALARGLLVISPGLTATLAPRDQSPLPLADELTPRELDVVRLLAEGLPNKLIADRLGISEHTVKFHVNAILGKLGAHSRTEAVTRAARTGLIVL